MSEEDTKTGSERDEPLDVKPIKGVKGTTRISAEKEKDQK